MGMGISRELHKSFVGNAFFNRRSRELDTMFNNAEHDNVIVAIDRLCIESGSVLEIGCMNGQRLSILQSKGFNCFGIDPSTAAIQSNVNDNVSVTVGTAENLPYEDSKFNVVIFGHCLYCCDRSDLFKIASEADSVLENGGHMIIYDFYPEIGYYNPLPDCKEIYSYKMDYSKMFSWHPDYKIVYRNISSGVNESDRCAVIVLKKNQIM